MHAPDAYALELQLVDEQDELFFVFFGRFEQTIPVVRIREWIPDRNVFRSE